MAGTRTRGVRRQFVFPWRKFACASALFIVGLVSWRRGGCKISMSRKVPPGPLAQVFSIFGLAQQELAFGIVGIIAILPGTA